MMFTTVRGDAAAGISRAAIAPATQPESGRRLDVATGGLSHARCGDIGHALADPDRLQGAMGG